jgi:hypothetical protein
VKDQHARTKVVGVGQNQTLQETPLDEQVATEDLDCPAAWTGSASRGGAESHQVETGEMLGDLGDSLQQSLSGQDSQVILATAVSAETVTILPQK